METAGDRGYRDVLAWKRGIDLVTAVYAASHAWPSQEQFGLTNQARRAAVSVPSNVAEGKGRSGTREYLHHASIAHGSLCELETQLLIALELGYLKPDQYQSLMDLSAEVGRLLRGLIKSLQARL